MTPRNAERLIVAGPAGDLEVVVDAPATTPLRGLALVCHPHPLQGGMHDRSAVSRFVGVVGHQRFDSTGADCTSALPCG